MTAVRAVVVVASNRAADGVYEDTSGPILVQGLASHGFDVTGPVVVHDGEEVAKALRAAVADGADLVVTSGGTGLTKLDLTPEMTSQVIDFAVPGIAEMIRAAGLAKTPHAALSRGIAGVAGRTLIVNLAGSSGAAKDGLAVLTAGLVEHAVSQLHGGDHARPDAPGGAGNDRADATPDRTEAAAAPVRADAPQPDGPPVAGGRTAPGADEHAASGGAGAPGHHDTHTGSHRRP